MKTMNDHYRVSIPYRVKGVNCAPARMVGRRFMGSRYGKATPILLTVIAVAALVLMGLFLMKRGGQPPVDPDVSSPASAEKPSAHLELPEVSKPAPVGPANIADADAARLKEVRALLSDVSKRHAKAESDLQGARYAALNANPELKVKLDQAQTLKREVAAMIGALPQMKQIVQARENDVARMQTVRTQTQELQKKISNGRKLHEKALAAGTPPPVDEATMQQMLNEQRQLKKAEAELRRVLLSHIKEVRLLQIESEKNHPEISAKSAEAARLRDEVNEAVRQVEGVASVFEERDALVEQRKELIGESSRLISRSNRVAEAAQGEGGS